MDFSSSFKKSFKSHGRQHSRKISAGSSDITTEHLPILSDHDHSIRRSSSDDHREVIVKIDSGADRPAADESPTGLWRESSYDFWTDKEKDKHAYTGGGSSSGDTGFNFHTDSNAAAQNIINQFPRSNNNNRSGEMFLDLGHIDDNNNNNNDNSYNNRNVYPEIEEQSTHGGGGGGGSSFSKELKVSFQMPLKDMMDIDSDRTWSSYEDDDENDQMIEDNESTTPSQLKRRNSNSVSFHNYVGSGNDEVLKCTSFQRRASILRTKTQSRLTDPPPPERRSERSGRMSGLIDKVPPDDDDDDIFVDDDAPDHLKKAKLDALTFVQWISLVCIVSALICTLVISEWKQQKFRGLQIWKWEVLVLVLICGRLVSGWGIRIVVFLIERNFMLRKRVVYFVYGLRKAVQNCIWLGLVLIAWQYLFDEKVEGGNKFLSYVNKLMWCMLVSTLIWLLKTLMVKVLASSFHVSTFFDRIQESLFNQYVIEMLSGPPLIELQHNQEEEEKTFAEISKLQNAGVSLPPDLRAVALQAAPKSGKIPARLASSKISGGIQYSGALPSTAKNEDGVITIDHLHKLNPKNISAWNMKRLVKIVRYGALSTLDEQIQNMSKDDSTRQIRSEYEAKRAARKIFRNVARPKSRYIYMQDLLRFLRSDEAMKAMAVIEGSSDSEKISRTDLKNWVVEAFRERRALALTLNDTKTAVNKLHRMVNVLVGIVIIIICLIILDVTSSDFLVAVTSQIVVVTFIFGNTCKTVFEAIIFLFVMHPFDVGDRCEIGGTQMIVEEMNILTTVFLRFDCQKIIYPNSTLSTIPIHNFHRSPDMDDAIDFFFHIATPMDKIALMRQKIVSWIENKKDHWYANPQLVMRNMEDLHKIKMSLWPTHKMNHQNQVERYNRRSLLVEEIVRIVKELDIEYLLYPIDINIKNNTPLITSSRMPTTWSTSAL